MADVMDDRRLLGQQEQKQKPERVADGSEVLEAWHAGQKLPETREIRSTGYREAKKLHVSTAQFGGSTCPKRASNEHSTYSLLQPW